VCFEQAGLRWVKQWLEARLAGSDPYFPLDTRTDEDPEAFVVAVLRDAGFQHPASELISRAVLDLLDRSRSMAPRKPAYFEALIGLCQRVVLPQAGTWFTEAIEQLAQVTEDFERRWGGPERVREIVFAAIVQAPGLPPAASRQSWLRLMSIPRYATLALLGLGGSFEDRLKHLTDWWASCAAEERDRELNQMMFSALKTHAGQDGRDSVQDILRSGGWSYPRPLKEAINRALRENGADPAFDDPSQQRPSRHCREGAIKRAGWRQEHLLPASALG